MEYASEVILRRASTLRMGSDHVKDPPAETEPHKCERVRGQGVDLRGCPTVWT